MDKKEDKVIFIPLNRLCSFPGHPFQVRDDDQMNHLVESIRKVGVLTPVTVRHGDGKTWQLISGHRRKRACELAGIKEIPAVVKEMDMDEAVIMMVDSNLQREKILPSEHAKAYKMKLDALKHQGFRSDLTLVHDEQKLKHKSTRDLIAENGPDSSSQIRRFVRLNELIPELLSMVDEERVAFTPAVELSYLTADEQEMIVDTIECEQSSPSLSQAQRMRKLSREAKLTEQVILQILREKKKPECWNLTLPMNQVSRYFPTTYSAQQMQDAILQLLERWTNSKDKKEK